RAGSHRHRPRRAPLGQLLLDPAARAADPGGSRSFESGFSGPALALRSDPNRPVQQRRGHGGRKTRSEEHTSELQSREKLVCRLPPSTLFPYTPLFRSQELEAIGIDRVELRSGSFYSTRPPALPTPADQEALNQVFPGLPSLYVQTQTARFSSDAATVDGR